jgi:hypothetical protein
VPDQPLEYRFTLTEQDLVDAARLSARPLFRLVAVLGGIVFVLGLALILAGVESSVAPAAVVAGPLAVVLARVGYVSPWAVRRRAAALIGAECQLSVTDEGVAYRQPGISGEIRWSALTGTIEDARMLFLMQGGVHRFGLPKRVFGSAAALEAFRAAVSAGIASAHVRGDSSAQTG